MGKKIPLLRHQAARDLVQGLSALVNVLYEKLGPRYVVLNVVLLVIRIAVRLGLDLGGQVLVERGDSKEKSLGFKHFNFEPSVPLGDYDVGKNVGGLARRSFAAKLSSRIRVQ